eukprot:m51a1_g1262 putative membrane protein (161) ;mRNA; r:55383-56263
METELVQVENPNELNFILGQTHFIKSVEDIYEAIVQTGTAVKFGLAFCEASGPCLIRFDGNDDECIELAKKNAQSVGAGHTFFVFLKNAFPVNVLNPIKAVPEVCRIFCATANPVQVVVAKSSQGRGVMGVIDGFAPKGVETAEDKKERVAFLQMIGYKR